MRRRDEVEADAGEIAAECDRRGEEWSCAGESGECGEDGAIGAVGAIVVPKVSKGVTWNVCWMKGNYWRE